jgi:hypothetical protein
MVDAAKIQTSPVNVTRKAAAQIDLLIAACVILAPLTAL